MRLNLLSEEKSVSAGSLFYVLITCSQKKVVRIFWLFDFLNNLYLWPLVCVTVENSKRSFVFTTTRPHRRLTLDKQLAKAAHACNCHTHAICHIWHLLSTELAQMLAYSLILSRLNYCNTNSVTLSTFKSKLKRFLFSHTFTYS